MCVHIVETIPKLNNIRIRVKSYYIAVAKVNIYNHIQHLSETERVEVTKGVGLGKKAPLTSIHTSLK